MKPESNQPMTRREFLHSLVRYSILGALLLTGNELLKRKVEAPKDNFDNDKYNCRICPLLPSCTKPQARQFVTMNPKALRDCKWEITS